MMKMVPARRLVTEASWEPPSRPPSLARSRAKMPLGKAGADCASITATVEFLREPRTRAATLLAKQRFVKIWLDGGRRHWSPSPRKRRSPDAAQHALFGV